MTGHVARCRCGTLTATVSGAPVRVSVCHCLDCQRRSGSAFSAQVRFADDDVVVTGSPSEYRVQGPSGGWATFRFCATCGGQIGYVIDAMPGVTAIPLGAFDDPHAFQPTYSVWESRAHRWVAITGPVEHD